MPSAEKSLCRRAADAARVKGRNDRMRVLHLIGGGDVGGAKTHVLSLLAGLKGHAEATLVSFRAGPFADEAAEKGIDTVVIEGGIRPSLAELRRLYREGKYDLVHCHGARGNMMGMLLRRFEKATVLTTVHSDPKLDYLGRPAAALTFGLINRFALRRIEYHVAVSDPVADMLIERGFSPYGVFPIYNGVDFGGPEPESFDRAAALARFGVTAGEGDVICGIAARLSPVKDIPTLLRAFAKAPENMKLILAGDGEDTEALKALSRELGIDGRVTFAGWVDDMDSFYRTLDINLLTSLSETFPYAITEGARRHCATISSRVGGVPMLIDHGVNGLLFEPGNVDALAGHLTTLARDGEKRRRFAEALYLKAKRYFSLEATISRQMEIYRAVLRRNGFTRGDRAEVTVCGAYGRGNAGDEAILEAIVSELRAIDPDLRLHVLSRDPKATRLRYRVDSSYTFNLHAMRREMKRSRLFINGGGSLMQDVTSTRSLIFYLHTLRTAHRAGAKVLMYGCGIGPITRERNRRRAGRYIENYVDAITLREDMSLEELKRLGVSKPEIVPAADPALTLSPADPALVESALLSAGASPEGKYLCLALRKWKGWEAKRADIAAAADSVCEKYGLEAVFLPIEGRDAEAAREVAQLMRTQSYEISAQEDARVVIGVLGRMRLVVSMRLHGLIFAAGQGVPVVGVSYDPKVSSFMSYLGADLCAGIESLTAEKLEALMDRAMLEGEPFRERTAELRALEARNVSTARKLLGELPGGAAR